MSVRRAWTRSTSPRSESSWFIVGTVAIIDCGRQDHCKLVLDVDPELDRELGDVDSEHASKLAERLVERPLLCSIPGPGKASRSISEVLGTAQKLAAACSHRPQMRSDLVILVVELPKLRRQDATDVENRLDTVLGQFNLVPDEQDPSVFEERQDSPSRGHFRYAWVPAHAEDRTGDAGQPPSNLGRLHGVLTCGPSTNRAFSVRSIS